MRGLNARCTTLAGLAIFTCGIATAAHAQGLRVTQSERPFTNRIGIMAGLTQPILFGGGNLEVEYMTRNFVFAWSHGAGLNISQFEPSLTKAEADAKLKLRMPWTTGPSVGYRLTNRLHATLDVKLHSLRASLPGGNVTSYRVTTVGPAVTYIQPIGRRFFIAPMLRWWPTVNNTLTDDKVALRGANGASVTHQAFELGFVPNLKVGYRF
jgi:hypothetical protein